MRIGLMIGPERGRYREKVGPAHRRRRGGRGRRVRVDLGAPDPLRLRRPHRDHPHGPRHERIELGTAVVPIQTRHPDRDGAAGAVDPGGVRRPVHARPRARRTTGSSRTCSACRTTGRPTRCATTSRCSTSRSPGPGPVDVENDRFQVHNPLDVTDIAPTPDPPRRARAGDAAHRRRADVGDDPLDGRRARDRRARGAAHHEGRRRGRDGPRRGSWPGSRSRCARTTRSTRRASGRTRCSGTRSTPRTTSACSSTATPPTSATCSPRATRRRSRSGCASFRDAGVTDLSVRVLPFGPDREARIESRRRTEAFLASLYPRALMRPTRS